VGLLQPLPIAKGHWQIIHINWMPHLPISKNDHNSTVSFVDHMTMRAKLWACTKAIDAPAFARIIINDIVHLPVVPQAVVSDYDVHFTEVHCREVVTILLMKPQMLTASHLELDGLSQNSDEMVVNNLHGITTHNAANWDNYLPLAKYSYNSLVHCSTKQMSFELDLGYEHLLSPDLIVNLQKPQANKSA